jgi:putative membrane protein
MNVRKATLAVLACCYLILWAGGVGSHLFYGRTPESATWAASAFLALAGLIVLIAADVAHRTVLLAVGALGLIVEAIGVHSGFPFGHYRYSSALQPQLIGVPLVMAAAWMALVAYVKAALAALQLSRWHEGLIAAAWMTAIDLVIDPLAAGELNYWRWIDVGGYYGIPTQNFLGWFAASWVIFALLNVIKLKPWQPKAWALSVGLSIILFFVFIALAHRLVVVAGIGFGLCALHWSITSRRQPAFNRLPKWRRAIDKL